MDLPSLKNQYAKRKRGNKIISSFARQVGETGFDLEPNLLKIILAICHDNNYKIRLDGAIFLKEYLISDISIATCNRFEDIYLMELVELLNDEESYIRIEVLETLTELLSKLEPRLIEKEFLTAFVNMFDVGIEELLLRVAKIFGKVVHGLKHFDMHKIYAE